MIDRIWIIPMILIITINTGFMIFNGQLPPEARIPDLESIFVDSSATTADGTIKNTYDSTTNTGSSFISQENRDSSNIGLDTAGLIDKVNAAIGFAKGFAFAYVNVLYAIGLPTILILIIAVPIGFLELLGFIYIMSLVIQALGGLLKIF